MQTTTAATGMQGEGATCDAQYYTKVWAHCLVHFERPQQALLGPHVLKMPTAKLAL